MNSKANRVFHELLLQTIFFPMLLGVWAHWRFKTFNSCEDLDDGFRAIPKGKDLPICTTIVSASVELFLSLCSTYKCARFKQSANTYQYVSTLKCTENSILAPSSSTHQLCYHISIL